MSATADRFSQSIELIEKLVSFDTESSKTNLPLVRWIEDELGRRGVPFLVLPNKTGDKASIFATFGPAVDGGVVLSGHTDVVPVTGQAWSSDPFALRAEHGRLYGRGACDMKGFVGVALAMADEFLEAELLSPIHLLLTYDEETTCLGPLDAIARFGADLPMPGCVIVGEPTMMKVGDSHKSVTSYVTRVIGKAAHSSRPAQGVSAIKIACDIVEELYRIGGELGKGSDRFDPPGSTVSVGVIRGGSARNVIAAECALDWEFRGEPHLPQHTALERLDQFIALQIEPALRGRWPGCAVETRCEVAVPGLRPEPGSAAEALALRLTRSNDTIAVPFATEAGRFQSAGLPVAICGPGSIDRAHQPDEYIETSQIEACIDFMRALVRDRRAGG